jgi:hypothetical protein
LAASVYCNQVQVSSISGSGAAGFDNGTGGPPDLGSTWQSPWGLEIQPLSNPPRLWVTDPGNHAVREVWTEGAQGATKTLSTRGNDGWTPDSLNNFGDVRGIHTVTPPGVGFFSVLSDATHSCIRGGYGTGTDLSWSYYLNDCKGTANVYGDRPVDTYLAQWPDNPGDTFVPLYVGSLDDGLGCINELRDDVGVLYTRGCRPAGSTVKLEAIAADPVSNALYTNNWLPSGSSTPDGVMKVTGAVKLGQNTLQLSILATGTAALPLHASGLTVGGDGYIYLADGQANAIYRIAADGSEVLLLAGGQSGPFADGTGCAATFSQPHGLAWLQTSQGKVLFVADTGNRRIRKLLLP